MNETRLLAVLLVAAGGVNAAHAADQAVDEVVVEAPHTLVETTLRTYGIVQVRYRSETASYDDVVYVEQTDEIPPYVQAFGVKLSINTTPPRQIRIAEVWSHPKIRRRDGIERHAHTVHLHTLDPPDVYSFYFPSYEYSTSPAGDWKLQLFLLDAAGPAGQNIELVDDPARFIAQVSRPFFEYAFEMQPD